MRKAEIQRDTKETQVFVALDLDGAGESSLSSGIPFLDHMLDQIARHGAIDLTVRARGDLHIDAHHTVEDSALALGQALRQALGDKRGIGRYGLAANDADGVDAREPARAAFTLPMDETLAAAVLDFSGRPYFVFDGAFARREVGGLATELVPHFFRSLCEAAGLNLHLSVRGETTHHQVEACFKAVARALRQALRREGRELPSTKGRL